jgi:hypothetical protein
MLVFILLDWFLLVILEREMEEVAKDRQGEATVNRPATF